MSDEELLAAKRADLAAVQAAITRVLTGAQESSLDDSSSRGMIKRPDIKVLFEERARLEVDIATIESRSCGSTHIIPGF